MTPKSRGPVPHHRVDRALYEQAKELADSLGWSMSRVASWGLEQYLSDLTTEQYEELKIRSQQAGVPSQRKQALPPDVTAQLASLWSAKDPRCDAYMVALYEEGWSFRSMADVVGVTRQSVYMRVQKYQGDADLSDLTPVPPAPFIPAAPLRETSSRPEDVPVDWPIWVDRDLHLAASQRARDERRPMYEVMETVLSDFLEQYGESADQPIT